MSRVTHALDVFEESPPDKFRMDWYLPKRSKCLESLGPIVLVRDVYVVKPGDRILPDILDKQLAKLFKTCASVERQQGQPISCVFDDFLARPGAVFGGLAAPLHCTAEDDAVIL